VSEAIASRFDAGLLVDGDAVAPWLDARGGLDGCAPRTLVHGMDLRGRRTPAALRSLVRQRMTGLRVTLLAGSRIRRALALAIVDDDAVQDRVCPGFAGAAESMHRRLEMMRGGPLALAVMVVPASAPGGAVRRCIETGAPQLPDGAAVVTWDEADGWGLRAAVALQLV